MPASCAAAGGGAGPAAAVEVVLDAPPAACGAAAGAAEGPTACCRRLALSCWLVPALIAAAGPNELARSRASVARAASAHPCHPCIEQCASCSTAVSTMQLGSDPLLADLLYVEMLSPHARCIHADTLYAHVRAVPGIADDFSTPASSLLKPGELPSGYFAPYLNLTWRVGSAWSPRSATRRASAEYTDA